MLIGRILHMTEKEAFKMFWVITKLLFLLWAIGWF